MKTLAGIEKKTRRQLAEVLRKSKGTVTVEEASVILALSRLDAAKLMARWAQQGWLTRVRRGLYAPVPLEARTPDSAIEDPWVVASRVFEPCYIGGWSATEHWGLTEQIFRTIVIITTRTVSKRRPKIQATQFWIKKIAKTSFFGTRIVWRGRVQILVSDPTKTVVDLLDDPTIGGGARMVESVLRAYLTSREKDIERLLDYGRRMKNGAIFKRLGYLVERSGINESSALSAIRERMTRGNAALDPALPSERLVTRWRLWVPEHWLANKRD
jgi:predicted transcriptional regulator of viral defense system